MNAPGILPQSQSVQLFVHSDLDDLGLNPSEFRVYAHLARRGGQNGSWPGASSIASHCRIHRNRVFRCVKRLKELGLITVTRRFRTTNLYVLTHKAKWKATAAQGAIHGKPPIPIDAATRSPRLGSFYESCAILVPFQLDDARLTPQEFRVYCHLARLVGDSGAWPSIRSVSEKCLLHRQTAFKSINRLKDLRMIHVQERVGYSNRYFLTPIAEWENAARVSERKVHQSPPTRPEVRDTPCTKARDDTPPKPRYDGVSESEIQEKNPSEKYPMNNAGRGDLPVGRLTPAVFVAEETKANQETQQEVKVMSNDPQQTSSNGNPNLGESLDHKMETPSAHADEKREDTQTPHQDNSPQPTTAGSLELGNNQPSRPKEPLLGARTNKPRGPTPIQSYIAPSRHDPAYRKAAKGSIERWLAKLEGRPETTPAQTTPDTHVGPGFVRGPEMQVSCPVRATGPNGPSESPRASPLRCD
jgi:DNA-binding MarR family transcriptional regulator